MTLTPDDLGFPFYAFSYNIPPDADLSFSYHVVFHDTNTRGMCNDIPCSICAFTCKDGINRQQELIDFARKFYPEHQI